MVAKTRTIKQLEAKLQGSASSSGTPARNDQPYLPGAELVRRARARQIPAGNREARRADHQQGSRHARVAAAHERLPAPRRSGARPRIGADRLMRDYDTLQKIYADLLAKKENSQISANLERAAGRRAVQGARSGAHAGEAVQPEPAADRADRRGARAVPRRGGARLSSSIATRRCAPRTRSCGRWCCRCSPRFR